ncbi:translation initiation factor 2 [Heliobacterium gestii]|uniref:Translation initiation factor 2 n=1 Tax=Heliomicrobium gestii TaxID=2699 RepID=A0A845LK28_HELGE|nr:translation initiation factor 2 [Heliomicrobium gestii]MBM7867198.1 hypothetical protein [Heliomicrobium gestii]MZP43753.1 translation initiation factor 2 [Heliomicrobium gestii]
MGEGNREPLEALQDEVDYLRSRLHQLRLSRRVLMALLETVDSERRDAIARLEAENRRLRRSRRDDLEKLSLIRSDDRKVLWICRNDSKDGE